MLSLLFSKSNAELENAHRSGSTNGLITLTQKAERIWNHLLPNRKLDLTGNEVHSIGSTRYHGKDMSDGERVILYMIAQVLVLKENSVIIIDEPELHIHKATLNKLWNKLESERQDCLFIYITHDLDFATLRNTSEVVWVKSFDGVQTWETEFLCYDDYSDLPSNLVYEIIGTQKKLLFVEGTKSSLDYLLYQELYLDDDFHIVPCGGCQEVIRCVRAKKGYDKFDSIQVYGVIDRDFRTENEIQKLQEDNIFCLGVAEVENLFVIPELLDIVEVQLGCDSGASQKAKDFISHMYNEQKSKQIGEAFRKEMDYQLSNERFDGVAPTADAITSRVIEKFTSAYVTDRLQEQEDKFNTVDVSDIFAILKVFNYKPLSENIGHCFGLARNNTQYKTRILNLIKSNNSVLRNQIIGVLKCYIPEIR